MPRSRRDRYDIWCTFGVDGVHGRRIGSWSTHYAASAASPARLPSIIRSGNRTLVGAAPTSGVLQCVGLRSAGHSLGVPPGRLRWQPRACPAMFEGTSSQPVCWGSPPREARPRLSLRWSQSDKPLRAARSCGLPSSKNGTAGLAFNAGLQEKTLFTNEQVLRDFSQAIDQPLPILLEVCANLHAPGPQKSGS